MPQPACRSESGTELMASSLRLRHHRDDHDPDEDGGAEDVERVHRDADGPEERRDVDEREDTVDDGRDAGEDFQAGLQYRARAVAGVPAEVDGGGDAGR